MGSRPAHTARPPSSTQLTDNKVTFALHKAHKPGVPSHPADRTEAATKQADSRFVDPDHWLAK